jgi:hypothetical protein
MEVDPTPTPTIPTKTGPDYEDGVVYDDRGRIIQYMMTRALTRDDGYAFMAQPTPESWHQIDTQNHPFSPQDITGKYIDAFQEMRQADFPYVRYQEYPYHLSRFLLHGDNGRLGSCWEFTSPFTGLHYEGVLPFFCLEIPDPFTGRDNTWMWFIEIFNDYQAYRGFAPYDPLLDGTPRGPDEREPSKDWYGWQRWDNSSPFTYSRPKGLTDILPKLALTDLQHLYYAHFHPEDFPYRKGYYGNPRRLAHHSALVEREVEMVQHVIVERSYENTPSDVSSYGLFTDPKFFLPNKAPRGDGGWSNYNPFPNWDCVFKGGEPVPRTASGAAMEIHLTNATFADINLVMTLAVNVTGVMTRVTGSNAGGNLFEAYFDTRNSEDVTFDGFGTFMPGSPPAWNYKTKWLYDTMDTSAYTSSQWLSIPNPDRTFPGVAWDGTGSGRGESIVRGAGALAWGSREFVQRTACPSYATDPSTEFSGVLMLAKAKVFEVTGRHQCPFTWHSTKGYIAWHTAM